MSPSGVSAMTLGMERRYAHSRTSTEGPGHTCSLGKISYGHFEWDGHRCVSFLEVTFRNLSVTGMCYQTRRNLRSELCVHMNYAGDNLAIHDIRSFLIKAKL